MHNFTINKVLTVLGKSSWLSCLWTMHHLLLVAQGERGERQSPRSHSYARFMPVGRLSPCRSVRYSTAFAEGLSEGWLHHQLIVYCPHCAHLVVMNWQRLPQGVSKVSAVEIIGRFPGRWPTVLLPSLRTCSSFVVPFISKKKSFAVPSILW